jgi:aminoglycoside phosphotransferase (APT) family kinase protein
MNDHHLIFLGLLGTELSRIVIPGAGNDATRQAATIAARQLQRILLDETVVQQLRADAIVAYRALLSALQSRLDAALHTRLEQVLGSEKTDWLSLDDVLGEATAQLQARDDESSRKLAGQLVAIDSRVRAGKEQAWANRSQAVPPPADAGGLGDLSSEQKDRLLAFLKQRFPNETGLQIASVRPLNGGFSKQTLFVDLAGNVELPERLVMRRDPPYETQGTSVSMEFPILQKVYSAGVSVPKPYAVDATGDVLGTPFMLVSLVPGRVLGDFLVVHEPSRAVALNMARQVAALHKVSIDGLEDLLPGGRMSVCDRVLGEIEKHDAMWKKVVHHKAYAVQAALDWLKRNIALAEGPRALVHRDIGLHNLLVHDDEVTAFLDWETVVVGTPAEDVAYAHYAVVQMMDWDEFVAAYEKAAGVSLDPRQLDFYMLWASVRIAVGICSMVAPVYGGERSSLLQFYLGDYFAQTLMNRLSAKLAEVLH